MNHLSIAVLLAISMLVVAVPSNSIASSAVEGEGGRISKTYLNGNEIALACGAEVNECVVTTVVYGASYRFGVDFKAVSLKPTFDNVALLTQGASAGGYMVTFAVGATTEQMAYMASIRAEGIVCYASMDVQKSHARWVAVECTPTYPSMSFDINKWRK